MKKTGAVALIILAVVIIFALLIGLIVPFLIFGNYSGGEMAKAKGGEHCFMPNEMVNDTSVTTDLIISRLLEDEGYKTRIDELGQEEFRKRVNEIVAKGNELNINPVIPVAIWWGEQRFHDPEKAFGWGYLSSGTINEALAGGSEERWQTQLKGVYQTIQRAIAVHDLYKEPEGELILTRLFYNFAEAMTIQYKESNGKWLRGYKHSEYGNPYFHRVDVIIQIQPNAIVCESAQITGVSSGGYACPIDQKYAGGASWGHITSGNYELPDGTKRGPDFRNATYPGHEGLDIHTSVGTRVYSASDGVVLRSRRDADDYGNSNITIKEKDGVYWYYTHLTRESITLKAGDSVNKGDLIATTGRMGRNPNPITSHLHIAIARNSNFHTQGLNWDDWYYPYEFLKDISCLNPPSPSSVNYPGS